MFQEFDKSVSSIRLTLQNSHLHLINLLNFYFKQLEIIAFEFVFFDWSTFTFVGLLVELIC